jgi:type I restriction enzyme S subunit
MKSNYSELGNYIREVNERNSNLTITNLLGVSMEKTFITSVANLNGVDLSIYKVLKNNQLACKLMSVGRDEKLPVDLYKGESPSIVSSAYYVFEPKNKEELLPEYLMMWLCRPENDRYIGFISGSDVRGGISWETFCSLPIKVPSITKQREIVKEYNVIQNRIALNQQLIQKLEETAQALYKQWFWEFEFPDENGQPYKSNGGEMVWKEELGKEIPKGWEVGTINDLKLDISDGNYSGKYPKPHEFIESGVPFIRGVDFENRTVNPRELIFISEAKHKELKKGHLKKDDILITTRGASIGKFAYVTDEFIGKNINSQLIRINGKNEYSSFYLGCMISTESFKNLFESYSTGSAQPQLPIKNFIDIDIIIPNKNILRDFEKFKVLLATFLLKSQQNHKLNELKDLLLSKLATINK